jgi:hypothetical protein
VSRLFNYSRAVAKALLCAEPNGQFVLSKIVAGAGYRRSEAVRVFGCERENWQQCLLQGHGLWPPFFLPIVWLGRPCFEVAKSEE